MLLKVNIHEGMKFDVHFVFLADGVNRPRCDPGALVLPRCATATARTRYGMNRGEKFRKVGKISKNLHVCKKPISSDVLLKCM